MEIAGPDLLGDGREALTVLLGHTLGLDICKGHTLDVWVSGHTRCLGHTRSRGILDLEEY